ncbi:ABC transporter permease [Symbiobacterium thermophilum]|uniref:Ribose ABC transporter permease n=1 Tax=Symbiobacterium thermophilum TaxID=2734 RepID=A0A953IAP2_SYMTR|nr:ribose ABC transporter permease [Symbiobacterium thermophilum]MBY6277199.1 ribose ABC transporter permease [Symbiobacterium thermophilum]
MQDKLRITERVRGLGPGLAVILMGLALSLLSDEFLTVSNLLNLLRQVSINAIIACGMTLVILTGGIDLSVGSVLAITGAVMAGLASGGVPWPLALLASLALGGALGLFNGVVITRGKVAPFVATLATMAVARGLTLVYTGGRPITGLPDGLRSLGTGYVWRIPTPVIVMFLVFALVHIMLNHTPIGRFIYAVGSNEEAARFAGIPVRRVTLLTYVLTGVASALAGAILTARLNSAQPTAGSGFELDAIAAVVIGGTSLSGGQGSVIGTAVGALIIGILKNGLNLLGVSSFYQQVAQGAVILLAVLMDRRK